MNQFFKHAPMAMVLVAAGVSLVACGGSGSSSGSSNSSSYVTMTGTLSAVAARTAGAVTTTTTGAANPAATATTVVATTAVGTGTNTAVVSGGAAVTNGQFSVQVVAGQTYTLGFYDPYGNLVGQVGGTTGAAAVAAPAAAGTLPLGTLNPVATTTPGLATTGGATGQVALLTPSGTTLTPLPTALGDFNNDGVCDEMEADRDGNGRPDKSEDRDNDGIPDVRADSNNDGRPDAFDDNDGNGRADIDDFSNGTTQSGSGGSEHGEHGEHEGNEANEGAHHEGSYGGTHTEHEGWEYGSVGTNGVTVTQTWGGTLSNVAITQAGGTTGVTPTTVPVVTVLTTSPTIPAASTFTIAAILNGATPVGTLTAVASTPAAGSAIPVTQSAAEAMLKTAVSVANANVLATMTANTAVVTYSLVPIATGVAVVNPGAATTLATGDVLTVTISGSVTVNAVPGSQSLVLTYTML